MKVWEEESRREYPVVPDRLTGSVGGRPGDGAREEFRAAIPLCESDNDQAWADEAKRLMP